MTSVANAPLVSAADVEAAAARIAGVAVRTPLVYAPDLTERFGASIAIKPESLQRTGSFKFRGAYNFISSLDDAARARGVVAPSSGNHGQAVACVAQLFGIPATIVMPTTVTDVKREGVERYGARAVLAGTTSQHRLDAAEEIVAQTGAVMVPPYDDVRIIAGQGTCGLEIVEDVPDLDTVLVPVGGGGLSSGVAAIVKARRPDVRVIAVEPAGAPKFTAARAAGAPVRLESTKSAADGLMAVQIGTVTFAHLNVLADDVITVSEDELRDATRHLFGVRKLVAEPSGAATLAAILSQRVSVRGPTVAVLSGGNVSLHALAAFCG
jgi:threonine dehydratase